MADLKEFKCTVSSIVYQNDTNKYVIAKTSCGNTITGYNNSPYQDIKNMSIALKGEWIEHKQYGNQFSFKELILDETPLFYFLSNVVKGIPKKELPKLMIKHPEAELLDIIENNPQKLASLVKGVGIKRVEQIKTKWLKYKQVFKLSSFFLPHNITIVAIEKFYQHFCVGLGLKEEKFIEMVKQNPYMLTAIENVGFKKADAIALKLGVEQLSFIRIKACVLYIIENKGEADGHTLISKDLILNSLDEYLYINIDENDPKKLSLKDKKESLEQALNELVNEQSLVELGDNYAYNKYYMYEKDIFNKIMELRNTHKSPMIKDIDLYILNKQVENRYSFSDEQKLAIEMVNSGLSIFSLCGYGGTGKTTIAKMILELFVDENNEFQLSKDEIVCCALSGIATDRIRKKTGFNSMTIASLLMKNKKFPMLPYKVYLIDESSMVNSMLYFQLLSKIPNDSYIILVGDPAQLPPIGTGDVFNDIIENGITPFVTLKTIFRQSDKQVIKDFAKSIREGFVPKDYKSGVYEDFLFMPVEIENGFKLKCDVKNGVVSENVLKEKKQQNYIDTHNKILEEYYKLSYDKNKQYLQNKQYFEYLYENQIIVPMKKGIIGVDNLNNSIQKEQFMSEEFIELYFKKFHLYDKVMHTMNMDMTIVNGKYSLEDIKNNSFTTTQERIFNGMVGVLLYIDRVEEEIWVYYPIDNTYVCYSYEEASELLTLSYCTTIHKTQGSEYDNVIIPMNFSYFIMLNNKLLYTALTRAKKYALFIGDSAAFNFTCMQFKDVKRKTVLQYLVKQSYPF